MTPDIGLVLAILVAAVVLFLSELWSADVVSLLVLLTLVLTGLLEPAEALTSFANPVVIAIASIFVVSAALFQTGVATRLGRVISRLAGDSEPRLIGMLMIGAALLSAVMNNVAVTAVLMPVVIGIGFNTGRPPSRLLLPVAYAAIVGGTLSLMGSPPNLIASETLVNGGFAPFGLLDITPIGVISTLGATAFMVTIGRKLLPTRSVEERLQGANLPGQLIDLYRLPERVFTLHILAQSPLVGETLAESGLGHDYGLTVLGIINQSGSRMAPPATHTIHAGDRLLAQGGPGRMKRAATDKGLKWASAKVEETDLLIGNVGVAEVTLTPRSPLAGKTLRELGFRARFGLTVLALWRGGEPVERSIGDEPLRLGDAFLVQGPWRKIGLLRDQPGLLLISEYDDVPHRTGKAASAIIILLAMLVSVVSGLLPISVAALGAAVAMVLTGCLRVDEARNAIEWRVVFLITGMLALGTAMQQTGAAQWVAETVLLPVASLGPMAVTAVIVLMTAILTLGISNHATAALVAPIAAGVATSQGLNPRLVLLAVAAGTTVALFTPFAHPSTLLVMGSGGYKPRDYVRVGLPLSGVVFLATLAGLALL
jgi:di/tricarboxylate transporter